MDQTIINWLLSGFGALSRRWAGEGLRIIPGCFAPVDFVLLGVKLVVERLRLAPPGDRVDPDGAVDDALGAGDLFFDGHLSRFPPATHFFWWGYVPR